jgi:16S rRNA processing protein RimM
MVGVDRDWMLIGRLAGALGVRGEIRIEPFTDFPGRFANLSVLYVGESKRAYSVEHSRMHSGRPAVKLWGIDTPERARGLSTLEVFVPRAEAADLPEGEFYLEDLIGMTVLTDEGTSLGEITEVLRTGSNDVYVVNRGRHALLIPGTKEAVKDLDFALKRMVVEQWVLEPAE